MRVRALLLCRANIVYNISQISGVLKRLCKFIVIVVIFFIPRVFDEA